MTCLVAYRTGQEVSLHHFKQVERFRGGVACGSTWPERVPVPINKQRLSDVDQLVSTPSRTLRDSSSLAYNESATGKQIHEHWQARRKLGTTVLANSNQRTYSATLPDMVILAQRSVTSVVRVLE